MEKKYEGLNRTWKGDVYYVKKNPNKRKAQLCSMEICFWGGGCIWDSWRDCARLYKDSLDNCAWQGCDCCI